MRHSSLRLKNWPVIFFLCNGPFEPHRLPMDEMEYTTLPEVMANLAGRWQSSDGREAEPIGEIGIPVKA